jgi:lysophosphatidylcholine acyltransferase/lyso-PAF acetyltransferase
MSKNQKLKRLSVFNTPELASSVNPFVNKTTNPSFYEKVKLVLMAPVACVRIACGISTVVSLALTCKLITFGLSEKDLKEKPLSPTRRTLLSLALKIGGRIFLFSMGFHWIETRGKMATTKEAPIVVANHTCMIDPFILGHMYCSSAVGAKEHLSLPVMGWIFQAQQLITVDRKDPNSRHEVKQAIINRSKPDSKWPQQTLIFPEATCTNGTALITFRGGPFAPGVPVQPVVVRFPHVHYDPCWVQGGPGMAMIFYRLCCQFHNFVEGETAEAWCCLMIDLCWLVLF